MGAMLESVEEFNAILGRIKDEKSSEISELGRCNSCYHHHHHPSL
jgi:hypothetical protein